MKIDGHRATAALSKSGLRWEAGPGKMGGQWLGGSRRGGAASQLADRLFWHSLPCSWSYETSTCCFPSVHSENGGSADGRPVPMPALHAPSEPPPAPTCAPASPAASPAALPAVPFSEMLAAEVLPPSRGVWGLPGTRLHRLVVWTFRRMSHNPAAWVPRQVRWSHVCCCCCCCWEASGQLASWLSVGRSSGAPALPSPTCRALPPSLPLARSWSWRARQRARCASGCSACRRPSRSRAAARAACSCLSTPSAAAAGASRFGRPLCAPCLTRRASGATRWRRSTGGTRARC